MPSRCGQMPLANAARTEDEERAAEGREEERDHREDLDLGWTRGVVAGEGVHV